MAEISACFVSKMPHTTLGIRLEYPVENEPKELLEELAKVGFTKDALGSFPIVPLPPLNGIQEIELYRKGSDLFGGWTKEEARLFKSEAQAVLTKFGFPKLPHRRLTWRDCV